MDELLDADLDSFIDLINKDDIESIPENKTLKSISENDNESTETDLDSLIGLINEKPYDTTKADLKDKDCSLNSNKSVSKNLQMVDLFSTTTLTSEQVSMNVDSSLVHTGDTSSEDEENKEYLNEFGKTIKKRIKVKPNYDSKTKSKEKNWTTPNSNSGDSKTSCVQNFFGVRIVNPIVSFNVLEERMKGRKLIKMSFLSNFIRKGVIEGDWVTIGIVVQKLPPKTSKAGKLYSVWKLTDLHNPENLISMFLFGGVHKEHWKTAVGTVIGLLNLSIMTSDGTDKMSFTLDHPGKLMLLGTSKDFGHCKSKRKDGGKCSNVVNLSVCEFCVYHLKSQYQKFSKRSEIQSSYSGCLKEPVLKSKVLKGQTFFYGGQSFISLGKPEKKSKPISSKDKLTLSNLTLKRKATEVLKDEKDKGLKRLAEMFGDDVSKVAEKNSEFINNQLVIPSAGSKQFLHIMKSKIAKAEENTHYTSPKELLKQHEILMRNKQPQRKSDSEILSSLKPQLGKNLSPGQNVSFTFSSERLKSSINAGNFAKLHAIRKIKENGPIERKNPNSVRSKPEPKKIEEVLKSCTESEENKEKGSSGLLQSRLGCIDLNSEKIQEILKRRSSHAYEVEMAEMEKEAAYFARLEKKELMEEKMSSTKEIVCDVVSCKNCKYTANSAARRCIQEKHTLKCHKAIKRFYECKDCKQRVTCFTRFPRTVCRCGSARFVRTGMARICSAPLLHSENFSITNNEPEFLNS